MKLYVKYSSEGVWAYCVCVGHVFANYFNCLKANGEQVSVTEVVKWLLKKTPIKSADHIYFECSFYNLVDPHYWADLGVYGELESWELPKRNVSGNEASEG